MRFRASGSSITAGGVGLAIVWGFHAAAFGLPGRAYFSLVGLNDVTRPVGANVLLHPTLICAALLAIWRTGSGRPALPQTSKCGIRAGLACWFAAATFSAIVNAQTDQVVLTYCSVFASAAAIYFALAGTRLTERDLELGLFGLMAGSLVPLLAGLYAFVQEWGIPDVTTTLGAYQNLMQMESYEAATFGNRGNTAGFIVLVAPTLLWVMLDRRRSRLLRGAAASVLAAIALNLAVLQVRAAFLTMFVALAVIWGFRLGARRYPVFIVAFALTLTGLVHYLPDAATTMGDRLRPIVTANTDEDASVMERTEAIREGIATGARHWQFGIGPGGALALHSQMSAHQLHVQQFLELGILGLFGATLVSAGVLWMLVRTLHAGDDGAINSVRFTLVIGPASFVVYGLLANAAFNVGYVNTWAVLAASMLALAPGLPLRPHVVSRAAPVAVDRTVPALRWRRQPSL